MTKYIILGHENPDLDSIVSGFLLEKLLKQKGYQAEFIIPDKVISQENITLCKQINIDPTKYQKKIPKNAAFILVDHFERITPGPIIAIIDHHPTTKKITCPYYFNLPSSSVSLLIIKNNEKFFSKNDFLCAIFAAMVDTVAFHSIKALPSDISWCQNKCQQLRFNYEHLLTLSMCPTDMADLNQAAFNGLKKHTINNYKIASSFLHLVDPQKYNNQIQKILDKLKIYRQENNLVLFAFLVHNITNFTSTLYKIKENTIEVTKYPQYASRGNIIIPELTKELTIQTKRTP